MLVWPQGNRVSKTTIKTIRFRSDSRDGRCNFRRKPWDSEISHKRRDIEQVLRMRQWPLRKEGVSIDKCSQFIWELIWTPVCIYTSAYMPMYMWMPVVWAGVVCGKGQGTVPPFSPHYCTRTSSSSSCFNTKARILNCFLIRSNLYKGWMQLIRKNRTLNRLPVDSKHFLQGQAFVI